MVLVLRKIGVSERRVVEGIDMDPEQEAYAGGSIGEVFAKIGKSPEGCHLFALMCDDIAVGFVVAREGTAAPTWVRRGCISLHNLRIDSRMRGRGFGKSAIRLAAQWIRANRPEVVRVLASVNNNNALAMRFNLARGFTPTGATVDGSLGPQTILAASVDTLVRNQ